MTFHEHVFPRELTKTLAWTNKEPENPRLSSDWSETPDSFSAHVSNKV